MNNDLLLALEVQRLRDENASLRREVEQTRNELDFLKSLREEKFMPLSDPPSTGTSTSEKGFVLNPGSLELRSSNSDMNGSQAVYILPVAQQQPQLMLVPQFSNGMFNTFPGTMQQQQQQQQPMQQHVFFQVPPPPPPPPFQGMPMGMRVGPMPQFSQPGMHCQPGMHMPPGMFDYSAPLGGSKKKSTPVIVSDRKAFVHRGVVYPPGLNRKEYRTIVFHSEEAPQLSGSFKAPPDAVEGDIETAVYEAWLEESKKAQRK